MDKSLKMYCVTNKPLRELENLELKLVGVGKNIFNDKYLLCNGGENINDREKHYSELTFHYWFWKNELHKLGDFEWIGFCQKRRFWVKSKNQIKKELLKDIILRDIPDEWSDCDAIICEHIKLGTKITKLLKRGWRNLIKKPTLLFNHKSISIKIHFDMHHGYGVMDQAIDLMDKKYREEFRNFVDKNSVYNPHIMFISKKKIMNRYFNDLFNWLFECEKYFGFKTLKGYDQTRLYAYLSERYLSFWFKKNTNFLQWPWTFFDFEDPKSQFEKNIKVTF